MSDPAIHCSCFTNRYPLKIHSTYLLNKLSLPQSYPHILIIYLNMCIMPHFVCFKNKNWCNMKLYCIMSMYMQLYMYMYKCKLSFFFISNQFISFFFNFNLLNKLSLTQSYPHILIIHLNMCIMPHFAYFKNKNWYNMKLYHIMSLYMQLYMYLYCLSTTLDLEHYIYSCTCTCIACPQL